MNDTRIDWPAVFVWAAIGLIGAAFWVAIGGFAMVVLGELVEVTS